MKRILSSIFISILGLSSCATLKSASGGNETNIKCIMMGDSITEIWNRTRPAFFSDNDIVSAGIGGQTSTQMLARFKNDVIVKSPKVVSILCGINDIAQNQGCISIDDICANISSMASMAKKAGIKVILCSTLPANQIGWNPSVGNPAPKVAELNVKIKEIAKRYGHTYLDYYTPLVADDGGLIPCFTTDGVHVTSDCYRILENMFIEKLSEVTEK